VGVTATRADGIDHAAFMLVHPHCRANAVSVLAEQPGTPLSARAGPALEFSDAATPIEPAAELGSRAERILRWLGHSDPRIGEPERRGITRAVGNDLPS
jgi:crotonobetainyl-CoA:carnitine CoA-transferase CaiB-like acyl-CoA transferase